MIFYSNYQIFKCIFNRSELTIQKNYLWLLTSATQQQNMNTNKQITIKRLQKEEIQLEKEPIPGAMVKRDGFLNFYFCIYDLDEPYKGGFYYGLLQLHENYPFSAPKLFFYTKSGRFEVHMSICTSFTSYHQQSWTSAWNVRSLILGTISFMTSQQPSYGCRNDSTEVRRRYAEISLRENMKIDKFRQLFGEQMKKRQIRVQEITSAVKEDQERITSQLNEEDLSQRMDDFDEDDEEEDFVFEEIQDQVVDPYIHEQEERKNKKNKTILITAAAVVGAVTVGGVAWYILTH